MSYGPKFLRTYNWLHVPVANGRELVTIAGVFDIDYKGGSPSGQWRKSRIELVIPFPTHILPQHNAFFVECIARIDSSFVGSRLFAQKCSGRLHAASA